ncbi:MAG: sugar phosphate isomerase/epimerase [Bacteroidaceae bacterium]|nr:sugar phosphate isomerase/epimerase [Bacteroidaceae bacterium]
MVNRRTFLRSSLAGTALLVIPFDAFGQTSPKSDNSTIKTSSSRDRSEGTSFHLGMAGYTFVKFDLDTTLAFMKKIDVHYLCIKDFHLPLDADAEQIAAFKAKLEAANVIGYAVGPIYMKDVAAVDKAFAYAQRVGVDLIVGVPGVWGDTTPNYEVLDRVEQKVKETNIRYAIHLHGPDMTLYPDATSIWNDVKDRDPRLGMCLDIGHNLRYGSDSIRDLKRYAKRVFDIHLKDVTAPTKEGHAIELGRGIIDFPAFVKMLRKVGYKGSVSLEYEKDMNDPFIGIAESVGYFKAITEQG